MRYVPKFERPSPAMLVAVIALFAALTGGAYAATTLGAKSVGSKQIKNGAVTHKKLGRRAVGETNLNGQVLGELHRSGGAQGPAGPKGDTGARGPKGDAGPQGPAGRNGGGGGGGGNGLNPAQPVVNVPTIAASSGSNPNPDSGDPGDQGFFFSGKANANCTDCSATLTNGELELHGAGIDNATAQGGVGIAQAENNASLGSLTALSYVYHLNQVNGTQAPGIHITVTGATADSKFASGFTNLTFTPALNGFSATKGAVNQADTFAPGALFYSTAETNIGDPGGQNNPQPLSYFQTKDPNAVIGQISLDNQGSSGGAAGNFDAGADSLIIGFGGSFTRYDFGG